MKEYYTPTIDEFCLGFEFEYFKRTYNKDNEYEDSEWVPSKVILSETNKNGTTHLSLEGINLQYYQIGLALGNKTIRVKKLDMVDVINLLDYDKCYQDFPESKEGLITTEDLNIIFSKIDITISKGLSPRSILFKGFIRNKTELIKLLKQLNIEATN